MGTVFVAPFLILSFKFEKKLLTTFQVNEEEVRCFNRGESVFRPFGLTCRARQSQFFARAT